MAPSTSAPTMAPRAIRSAPFLGRRGPFLGSRGPFLDSRGVFAERCGWGWLAGRLWSCLARALGRGLKRNMLVLAFLAFSTEGGCTGATFYRGVLRGGGGGFLAFSTEGGFYGGNFLPGGGGGPGLPRPPPPGKKCQSLRHKKLIRKFLISGLLYIFKNI